MLATLARCYAALMRLRNRAYDSGVFRSRSIGVPVISVGNITAGGTGKTPVVEYLVGKSLEEGWHPAVVTRGYRRKSRGTVVVSDGKGSIVPVMQSGDEAGQIARKYPSVPVIADADRVRGAHLAACSFGADMIVLDDAFQHRAIRRDCDIVVVDASDDFAEQRILPKGRLREPLDHLRRADILLLTRCRDADSCVAAAREVARWSDAPIYVSRFEATQLRSVQFFIADAPREGGDTTRIAEGAEPGDGRSASGNGQIGGSIHHGIAISVDELRGRKVMAFCGIGSPGSFRTLLESFGAEIIDFRSFPDHYWYTAEEIDLLLRDARSRSADTVLTTEKDAMRLEGMTGLEAGGKTDVLYPLLSLRVLEREEELLLNVWKRLRASGSRKGVGGTVP